MSILFGIIIGVVTTVIGSWVVSRIHLYQEARNAHRDEIKEQVLEPLRTTLMTRPTSLFFSAEFTARSYDHRASAEQAPTKHGYVLRLSGASLGSTTGVDDALFEDARTHHHQALMAAWRHLTSSWAAHVDRWRAFIDHTADDMLSASGIQPFPTENSVARPYVRHLTLAVFIQARLQGTGETNLRVVRAGNEALLTDGSANLASGSFEQMQKLLTWINDKMVSARPLANRLALEFGELQAECAEVSRQFSLAIAAKKLSRDCPLVRFW